MRVVNNDVGTLHIQILVGIGYSLVYLSLKANVTTPIAPGPNGSTFLPVLGPGKSVASNPISCIQPTRRSARGSFVEIASAWNAHVQVDRSV